MFYEILFLASSKTGTIKLMKPRRKTMSQSVLQFEKNFIQQLIKHYEQYKVERNGNGILFAAKLPNISITVYHSNKVLFQGKDANLEASKWQQGKDEITSKKVTNAMNETLPKRLESLSVIGSDETGTGDYFGPITVAAVFVPSDKIELLTKLGVQDSKTLTDAKMVEMAPIIKKNCIYSLLVLPNEKYNTVQEKGWSQGKIKALLHNKALSHVLRKMNGQKPDYILIDQFATRDVYYRHIQNEKEIIRENVLFATKAEQLHVSVAAASIIARVAFVEKMDELGDKVGIELPKGAGSQVDETAAIIYKKFGETTLKNISKWHFANTNKVIKIARK